MKKIIIVFLVLAFAAVFLPAAFAGDTEDCRPWFHPTLRVGVAFDAQPAIYHLSRPAGFLGMTNSELKLGSVARPYFALELPFHVTDRLAVTLNGDWSFTSSDRWDVHEHLTGNGITVVYRTWETDETAHWVSAEALVSYALIKDWEIIKDLSVVAGVQHQLGSFGSVPIQDADPRAGLRPQRHV
jgi:hypothetical protein